MNKLKKLDGDIYLSELYLKEIPDSIAIYACRGSYMINNNSLKSLKNAPKIVEGKFNCNYNKLTTLEDGPQEVTGDYLCNHNNLTSLEGAPIFFGHGKFHCALNKLTSLKGLPTLKNGSSIFFGSNRITSLQSYGFEDIIFYNFYGDNNNITSLVGGPKRITGNYDCSENPITSFVGAPRFIGGDFSAMDLKNLTSLDGFPNVIENNAYLDGPDLYRLFPNKNSLQIKNEIKAISNISGRIYL